MSQRLHHDPRANALCEQQRGACVPQRVQLHRTEACTTGDRLAGAQRVPRVHRGAHSDGNTRSRSVHAVPTLSRSAIWRARCRLESSTGGARARPIPVLRRRASHDKAADWLHLEEPHPALRLEGVRLVDEDVRALLAFVVRTDQAALHCASDQRPRTQRAREVERRCGLHNPSWCLNLKSSSL